MKDFLRLISVHTILIAAIVNSSIDQDIKTVKDQEGNNYRTVTIGTQTWMAENIRTTIYNDGTTIPLVTDNREWAILSAPAFCWYNNDTINKNQYGALYNGYAVKTDKVCPDGWHIATDSDWTMLVEFLGGEKVAGVKLKEAGTIHWKENEHGGTNESGFTALPGGTRYTNGLFVTIRSTGYWWTFSGSGGYNGWYRSMNYSNSDVSRNYHDATNGFSVRCIRD